MGRVHAASVTIFVTLCAVASRVAAGGEIYRPIPASSDGIGPAAILLQGWASVATRKCGVEPVSRFETSVLAIVHFDRTASTVVGHTQGSGTMPLPPIRLMCPWQNRFGHGLQLIRATPCTHDAHSMLLSFRVEPHKDCSIALTQIDPKQCVLWMKGRRGTESSSAITPKYLAVEDVYACAGDTDLGTALACHASLEDKDSITTLDHPGSSFIEALARSGTSTGLKLSQMESAGDSFSLMAIDKVIGKIVEMTQQKTAAKVKTALSEAIVFGEDAAAVLKAASDTNIGPVVERTLVLLADSLYGSLRRSLSFALLPNLQHSLNQSIALETQRAVTGKLVAGLVDALAPAVSRFLVRPAADAVTRIVTHEITRTVAPALALSVSRSTTRRPIDDYFCSYCESATLYCESCRASVSRGAAVDFYVNSYAQYYSSYYGAFYSEFQDDPALWNSKSRFPNAKAKWPSSMGI